MFLVHILQDDVGRIDPRLIGSVDCSPVAAVSMFSAEIPSSVEDRLGHILPMAGLRAHSCRRIGASEVMVGLPIGPDYFEVISTVLFVCEDSQTTGDQFFELVFRHGFKLVGVLPNAKSHECGQPCDCLNVEEVGSTASLLGVVGDDNDVMLFMLYRLVLEDDQYLADISEVDLLDGLLFPLWQLRTKLDCLRL